MKNFEILTVSHRGVDQLRSLIYDLAIHGKLVEQDPADEPVVDFMARLEAERSKVESIGCFRLTKTVIPPSTPPFQPPKGWTWTQLNYLAHPQAGFAFKSEGFNTSGLGMPLVRIRDIGSGRTECFYDGEFRSEFVIAEGDYLVGMDGNFNIRRWTGEAALLNQRVTRLVFFGQEIMKPFVAWALQAAIDGLHGTKAYTTVQHLSGKQIADAPICVPPIAEQERIVAKVSELMSLCDELEMELAREAAARRRARSICIESLRTARDGNQLDTGWWRLESQFHKIVESIEDVVDLRNSILDLAVRGYLSTSSSDDEDVRHLIGRMQADLEERLRRKSTRQGIGRDVLADRLDIPTGWSALPLQEVAQFVDYRGRTPKKTSSGVPLITAKNIRRGFVRTTPAEFVSEETYEALMTRGLPKVGDVLFTTEAPMGNAAVVRSEKRFALAQRTILFSPYADFSGEYLEVLLLSPWFQSQLRRRATGMTATGIKAAKLRLIEVPFPSTGEQKRIVHRVGQLMAGCDELEFLLHQRSEAGTTAADALVVNLRSSWAASSKAPD